ncbi:MAG: alpha-galactosidase [Victivallaceae bacterium]|nr:alpha-galactosidase [Victivallaceae bacterium]
MTEKKTIGVGAGTSFLKENNSFILRKLFSMTCAYNGELNEEVPALGGTFTAFCNKKKYETNKLLLAEIEEKNNELIFILKSKDNSFSVVQNWKYSAASKLFHCKYKIVNNTNETLTINRALAQFTFSHGDYELYTQKSHWGCENIGSWIKCHGSCIELRTASGRSSCGNTPFCVLKETETNKAVAFHVIPKGNWVIRAYAKTVNNEADNCVIEAGLSDNDLFFDLASQEELELPEIIIQEVPDCDVSKSAALLHRYCLGSEFEKKNLAEELPLLYNTWLYRFTDFTVKQLDEQLKKAKEIGLECFVVDAGWAGENDEFWGVGNWKEKTKRAFLGRVKDFAEKVRKTGLKFGIWIEPEQFPKSVPIVAEHPEWFFEDSTRINLNLPQAREYFKSQIRRLVEDYSVEYIKTDMNIELGFDESGEELYSYCKKFREVIEEIKAENPSLIIENCASGALRNDLGTQQYFDCAFLSDNVEPFESIRIFQGTILRGIPGRISRWATIKDKGYENNTVVSDDKYVLTPAGATWQKIRYEDINFILASCLCGGGLGFSGDIASLDEEKTEIVKEYIAFYKENRKLLYNSVVHVLTELPTEISDPAKIIAIQFHNEKSDESILMSFMDPASRKCSRNFKLRGLRKNRDYKVMAYFDKKYYSYTISGEELTNYGMEVKVQENMHCHYKSSIWKIIPHKENIAL